MKIEKFNGNFSNTIIYSIENILTDIANGKFPVRYTSDPLTNAILRESNLFGYGANALLGQDRIFATEPNERNIVTISPKATVLLKKKAFSNFKNNNDVQWLDKTEKMLLRATKALFAYKVTQIRAYESLSKIETFFQKTSEINLNLLVELFNVSRFAVRDEKRLWRDYALEKVRDDVLLILERNAFASELPLTTWIVDPNDPDNYGTGPGTGVIELATFTNFQTSVNISASPSNASLSLEDPYRIMYITEGDIELAIEEAFIGTIGLLKTLGDTSTPVDSRSIVSANLEKLGLGGLDSELNVDYIRDRLRVFYLGKPIINPGDGIHFFIRSNRTVEDFSKNFNTFDRDYLAIDQSILEAERVLFTNKNIDFETYKNLRQFSDESFGMKHVWAGVVSSASESWSGGKWNLSVDCQDNMTWLMWSRFMEQPTAQNVSGVLEDPLTPYEIKKDASNTIIASGAPELLEENKRLIRSGLLTYDSGLLNGQFATEANLLQGQFNYSGSLSGKKVLQHPQGLVYRWKEGILVATAALSKKDNSNETTMTNRQYERYYGQTIAQNVLNNLDIANILSLLIVGQPYNMESFIDQAVTVANISSRSGDLKPTDPLTAVLNVVRANNSMFGNFQPYRLITLSSQTLMQSANNYNLKIETNENVRQMRQRIITLDALIEKLKQPKRARSNGADIVVDPIANSNDFIIRTLEAERETLQRGIRDQINLVAGGGNLTSKDIITQNFNLFGKMKTLPLTGNYTADHQLSRAMTLLGAQRRIEDVRLNRDKNLFIVSDQYDELTDIRPLLLQVGRSDYRLFKGEFVQVHDKCAEAAGFLNLEFFCNSQGHIEFRPPQWNKTPLSILERLFDITRRSGKRLVPEFLIESFETRSASIRREIHQANIRIVILCLLLDRFPDRTLIPNFTPNILATADPTQLPPEIKNGNASLEFFGVYLSGAYNSEKTPEAWLDDGSRLNRFPRIKSSNVSNKFFNFSLKTSIGGREGDILSGDTETLLGEFDPVFQESVGLSSSVLTVAGRPTGQSAIKIANVDNVNAIREYFMKLSGNDPAADLVTNNGKFQESDFIYSTEALDNGGDNIDKASKYLKKLQETISNRDRLVTILKRNKAKIDELDELETIISGEFTANRSDLGNLASNILNSSRTISDIFSGDATKGSLLDHLVEDDRKNLTGPGSGRRFIIKDEEITQCTFTEKPPDYCRADFTGNAPISGSGLNDATESMYFWAGVVDFDLWRQYGFTSVGGKALPFSNDAETVTKPYAITDIQLQKIRINQASVSLVGNEYYEPGDVVYIQAKQLLYYVRSVAHSYDFSGAFTTTLTLEFGHPPGTYLPSPLDIIGQQYSRDSLNGSFITYRNSQGDDYYKPLQPDCCIAFPFEIDITEDNLAVLLSYKDNALRFNNIITELNTIIQGSRLVLIRGFVTDDSEEQLAKVNNNISIIKKLLQQPVSLGRERTNIIDDISNLGGNITSGLGVGIGNQKTVEPMKLPTGLPIFPIPIDKIAEQVVYLSSLRNSETNSNEFTVKTFNPQILSRSTLKGKEVTVADYLAYFPKGGPKQRTWLDIRLGENFLPIINGNKSYLTTNVIEIGILDIERAINENY